MAKRNPQCRRCRIDRKWKRNAARGNFAHYATRANTEYGFYNVEAAELILRLAPRDPIPVTAKQLRVMFKRQSWQAIKRHLPHVNNAAPGILVTVRHAGRPHLELIEGYHRATNHLNAGTDWSCYVLNAEEKLRPVDAMNFILITSEPHVLKRRTKCKFCGVVLLKGETVARAQYAAAYYTRQRIACMNCKLPDEIEDGRR